MKRTCYKCRALDDAITERCMLGFAIGKDKDGCAGPLEECPKPLTHAENYEAIQERIRKYSSPHSH